MRKQLSKQLLNEIGALFFYRSFHRYFFPKKEIDTLYITAISAKSLATFCYAAIAIIFLFETTLLPLDFPDSWKEVSTDTLWIKTFCSFFAFVLSALFIGDFIPRTWAANSSKIALKTAAPLASIFLFIAFPFTYFLVKLSHSISNKLGFKTKKEASEKVKEKIVGIIQEAITTTKLNADEQKLIESVVSFKDRIVREVMVPRVDIFSLPATTTIREAAKLSLDESFSRIPVFSENVDSIIGLLMYKDVLKLYINSETDPNKLDAPISTILKPVLYTPETKKISYLLQEFRNTQMHLAIVVDEYGGTEGIVTIEDILEEIVGEIEDEYDKEEKQFEILPHGGWIVDARMSILDIEDELGLKIPQDGEYDTLGGYVFYRAGSIPSKGLQIHHDDFELEILSSNDRSIQKVRITPSAAQEADTLSKEGF